MSAITKNLEKMALWLFLFSVPFQTRLILFRWREPFNEWTSIYLYGTDLLIVILIGLALYRKRSIFFRLNRMILWSIVVLLAISFLSIFEANVLSIAWYRWFKLFEFSLVFIYFAFHSYIVSLRSIAIALVASALFQSFIALIQSAFQHSVGIKILGESFFNLTTDNVAHFYVNGFKYIRAYGTLPHANVLATWISFGIFMLLYLAVTSEKLPSWLRSNWYFFVAHLTLLFGLFVTYSRAVITVTAIILIALALLWLKGGAFHLLGDYGRRAIRALILSMVLATVVFLVMFYPQIKDRILISASEEAVVQRIYYNKLAENTTGLNLSLGVGIGQFVPNMYLTLKFQREYFYQPVHNIYLLISSETGIAGVLSFLVFIALIFWTTTKKFIREKNYHHLIFISLAGTLILIGLFDHFLMTLQQGYAMLWLSLAFMVRGDNIA